MGRGPSGDLVERGHACVAFLESDGMIFGDWTADGHCDAFAARAKPVLAPVVLLRQVQHEARVQ